MSILIRKSDGISIEVVKLYATLCRGDKILQICDVSTWEQHIIFSLLSQYWNLSNDGESAEDNT